MRWAWPALALACAALVSRTTAPFPAETDWDLALFRGAIRRLDGGVFRPPEAPQRRRMQQTKQALGMGQQCTADSKLWFMKPRASGNSGGGGDVPGQASNSSKGNFFFGSYHYNYKEAWPRLPLNNRLALHSCDKMYTEIDFNDKHLVRNFDKCMLLPGNMYNRAQNWPHKTVKGDSLLDLLDAPTKRAVQRYMRGIQRRFRPIGHRLAKGWEALKPMAWMMKYAFLAEYGNVIELLKDEEKSRVLDRFIFDQAAKSGMETGGVEDGTYMCLLFDTIETKEEASAYLGSFLSNLKNGMVMELSDDSEQVLIDNSTKTNSLTGWYTCRPLCDFASAWNAGLEKGFRMLGQDKKYGRILQRVQKRQVQALGMHRNRDMASTVERLTQQQPNSRHCFVLGLAHLLDHDATCSGNDVVQLLNSRGHVVRHVPPTENICMLMKKDFHLRGLHLGELRVRAEKAGVEDELLYKILKSGKSDDVVKEELVKLLEKKFTQDWSVLMSFIGKSTQPWFNASGDSVVVKQDLLDVCNFTGIDATPKGPACPNRTFQCNWGGHLNSSQEQKVIGEMEKKWERGNESVSAGDGAASDTNATSSNSDDFGLYFEAFPYSGGGNLTTIEKGVLSDDWNQMVPKVANLALGSGFCVETGACDRSVLWLRNSKDLAPHIPGFRAQDKYIMRWRGEFRAESFIVSDCLLAGKSVWPCLDGTYRFLMTSNAGSRLYVGGELVVDNDGLRHRSQTAMGKANLNGGWHKLVVVFLDIGADPLLQVAVAAPDTDWQRVWVDMTRPLYRRGLYFEAFPYKGGELKDWDSNVLGAVWNGMMPTVSHEALAKDVWYSNDRSFVREIPQFKPENRYIMRWRGMFEAPTSGLYSFATASDEGSRLYIGATLVVDNDGHHSMRDRKGEITLPAGWHAITITFFEDSGEAGLEVAAAGPDGRWKRLSANMTRAAPQRLRSATKKQEVESQQQKTSANDSDSKPSAELVQQHSCTNCGMLFEAFPYKGGRLQSWTQGVLDDKWNAMVPMISHLALGNDLWYTNDNDFVRQIPGFSSWDKYIMRWRGDYNSPQPGTYRFATTSDDGSRLYVSSQLVVDNDGHHSARERTGKIVLSAGWHPLTVVFFEDGGDAVLKVSVALPGAAQFDKLQASMTRPRRACKCPGGTAVAGQACAKHGLTNCSACDSGHRSTQETSGTRTCKAMYRLLVRQTAGTYLDPPSKWMRVNPGNSDGPNYCVLDTLDNSYRGRNGKFQFQLRWPLRSGSSPKQNTWRQLSNPVDTSGHQFQGYEPLDVPFVQNGFSGLQNTGQFVASAADASGDQRKPTALLAGAWNQGHWYYTVGSREAWGGGIAGAQLPERRVELWVLDAKHHSPQKACYCPDGVAVKADACRTHGTVQCAACNLGYKLDTGGGGSSCVSQYKLLFRQTAGTYLSPVTKWRRHNAHNSSDPNFSILDELNDSYRDPANGGKFTFKLQWPKFNRASGKNFNLWRQTTNPVASTQRVVGYEPVRVNFEDEGWGGLENGFRHGGANPLALLDGTVNHAHWYYAVGTRESWSTGIPAATWPARVAELYVLPPPSLLDKATSPVESGNHSNASAPPTEISGSSSSLTPVQDYDNGTAGGSSTAFFVGLLVIFSCCIAVLLAVSAMRRGGVRLSCLREQTGVAHSTKTNLQLGPKGIGVGFGSFSDSASPTSGSPKRTLSPASTSTTFEHEASNPLF